MGIVCVCVCVKGSNLNRIVIHTELDFEVKVINEADGTYRLVEREGHYTDNYTKLWCEDKRGT